MASTPAQITNPAARYPLGLFAPGSVRIRSVDQLAGVAEGLVKSRF